MGLIEINNLKQSIHLFGLSILSYYIYFSNGNEAVAIKTKAMNRQNIQQIIRELFKDNYNAYPNDYYFSNDNGQQARLNARTVAKEYWETRTPEEAQRDEKARVTKDDYIKWVMAELSDLIPAAPNKFQTWASEINKDWSTGYKAEATEDALSVNFNSAEVARIDYNNGRYTVTGNDKEAVEQLEYMVNR